MHIDKNTRMNICYIPQSRGTNVIFPSNKLRSGEERKGRGDRANHWPSKFPRVENHGKGENPSGCFNVSLLERDHTE